MNNENQRPLQQRADEIRVWLKDRLATILQARKERAEEFRAIDSAIHTLEGERDEIKAEIKQAQGRIADREKQIASLQAEIELLHDTIQHSRDIMDGVTDVMLAHEKRLDPIRKKWASRMRAFGDGKVRRKRAELAKVERRIQSKIERAERSALLKEPLTAQEIGMGITFEEKLARQQESEEKNARTQS